MSALGQSGSAPHPGLSFPQVGGMRRGAFQPNHAPSQNKGSPVPHAASPYQQQQAYAPQQTPQATYPHHLFNQASVNGNVANPAARGPQSHVPSSVVQARQRAAPPRQQTPSMMYSQHQMTQPMHSEGIMSHQTHQPHQSHQQQPHQTHQGLQHQPHPSHPAHPSHQTPQSHVGHQTQQHQAAAAAAAAHQVHQAAAHQSMAHQPQHVGHQTHQAHQPHQTHQAHQAAAAQQQAHQAQQQQQARPQQTPTPTIPPQPQPQQQVQVPVQNKAAPKPQPQPPGTPVQQHQEQHAVETMDMDPHADNGDDNNSNLDSKAGSDSPFVPRHPMGEMMSAPPEGGSYPTLEAVHKSVLQYCTSVGYAIVIGRSKKTVPGLKKVLFVCDRAGKPPNRVSQEARKRKTSSRKCDCPFGFFAIEQRTQWTIRYRPDAQHLQHNHGPSDSPLNHPAARKLDSKMVAAVKSLKENGVGVSQTLEILQEENPHAAILPRDIYNARAAINRNPQKVESALAENRPAIYSKPHPTAEERIRADLRRELSKTKEELDKLKEDSQKEIDDLKAKIAEKDQMIEKFEMFIDICNERVMVQRKRLAGDNGGPGRRGAE